jgi:hypothetical protein
MRSLHADVVIIGSGMAVRTGRRFESVRGLCKSPARRGFCIHVDWQVQPRAVGMEPFMELSSREQLSAKLDYPAIAATTASQFVTVETFCSA